MSNQIEINSNLVKYLKQIGYRPDPIVDQLVQETNELGKISQMQIAKEQGQFLEIITNLSKARSCLEIGRFTGLSTLFLARGLTSQDRVVTVDNSNEFLELAKKYWDKANVSEKIESIIGEGVEVMQSLIDRQSSFDLIFIDADKNNYPNYYELSLQLIPSNGIILIDNMLWHGDVANSNKNDSQTNTIRDLNLKIQKDSRVDFSLLPLSDGLSIIRKK
tara:strand:+ start:502 stop:1158 length:657 start_codon:yes stop_codon:yes gene_type:complete